MTPGIYMPIDFNDEEQKRIFREAVKAGIDAWLTSKMAEVGKWSLRGIIAAALAALVHFITSYGGWHK